MNKNNSYKALGLIILMGVMILYGSVFVSAFDWTSGLISYYSTDESSGVNMKDNVTSNYNGTLLNGATFSNGKLGNGIYFDGINDMGRINNSINMSSASTISFWINVTNVWSNGGVFSHRDGNNWQLQTTTGGSFTILYWGLSIVSCTSPSNILTNNTWVYLTVKYNGTDISLYRNGVQIKDCPSTGSIEAPYSRTGIGVDGVLGGGNLFKGFIDEIGFWNRSLATSEILELYNDGNGLAYKGVGTSSSISINLTSPTNNSVILISNSTFLTNLNITGKNYSYEWKNNTFNIWFNNGTLFQTNFTNGLTSNVTNVSTTLSGFNLGNYLWNTYACYGNTTYSNCNWSNNGNYSLSVGLSVSSVSYNSTTIPTSSEIFLLQGTKTSFTSSVSAFLWYNGTSYPSTVSISGNDVNITNKLTVPDISGNASFYWVVNSFGTSGSVSQNSSSYNQTIGNLSIYACTSPPSSGLALNFTLYDGSTKLKLNGSLENTFTYFAYGGTGTISKTYNFQSINASKSNWMFCINSTNNQNVSFSGTASYYSDYYDRREYMFNNAIAGNFTQDIPLYLALITDTDVVTVTVTDQNYNPIKNALVTVQEWNVGTNTYSTIGMFYTDSNGNGIINLEIYNIWYRAIVSVDGNIIKTTDVLKLATTTWGINVVTSIDNPYDLFGSISHGLVFDNFTNITTFSWLDGSGYVNYGCLEVRNKTNLGYRTIYNSCVSSVAGTINYMLSGDGDYEIIGTIYLLPLYNVSEVTDTKHIRLGVPTLTATVSPYGKVLSFVFIGVFTSLGIAAGSPILGIILLIISIFVSKSLGWLNITETILWTFISIAVIIVLRQTRK
jgi:hypothetical protein